MPVERSCRRQSLLFLKQRVRQFEALLLVWARIENHPGIRAETFNCGHIVHAKAASLVQSPGMGKQVPTARPVDMKFDTLAANRTLCTKGVNSASADELYKFEEPNRYVSHWHRPQVRSLANISFESKL
jgi:hypothetical protein